MVLSCARARARACVSACVRVKPIHLIMTSVSCNYCLCVQGHIKSIHRFVDLLQSIIGNAIVAPFTWPVIQLFMSADVSLSMNCLFG